MTVKDKYPFTRMDESIDLLGEAHYFSTPDEKLGYWKINIRKQDRQKPRLCVTLERSSM